MPLKALILEDDKQLASSLKELFIQKGMDTYVSHSVKQAKYTLVFQHYDLILADLVMPDITGVDFIRNLVTQQLVSKNCTLWLMSGILSPNSLPSRVQNRINHFFKKPLDPNIINQQLDSLKKPQDNLFTKNVQALYMQNHVSRDTKFLLDFKESIQSHELMFIYFILNLSQFTGCVSISYQNSETAKVFFKNGHVIEIPMKDKESYIGNLLVKNNLVSQEKIDRLLQKQGNNLLGQELINDCGVSPHLLQKVLKEQLTIRLLKTMNHQTVTIKIEENVKGHSDSDLVSLATDDLLGLVDPWIKSKVDLEWLKKFFKSKAELFIETASSPIERKLKESSFPFLKSTLNESLPSAQLNSQFSEDQLLKLYVRLLIKENYLQQNKQDKPLEEEYKFMKKRLEDFMRDSAKKNSFDWLNLPWKASPSAVEENYRIVIKLFHPDRIDKNMPEDLKQLCQKCFISITKAYNHLVNENARERYISQVETGSTEDLMDIYTKYNKGKSELQKDNFSSAFKIFDSLLEYKKAPGDTLLYYIWARLKNQPGNKILPHEERDEILKLFDKIQTKYQKTDVFFFTRGLFLKATGHRKAAFDFFTKATKINPRMIKARQERFTLKKKKKKGLFGLFKRVS